jgi:hypothetical protein
VLHHYFVEFCRAELLADQRGGTLITRVRDRPRPDYTSLTPTETVQVLNHLPCISLMYLAKHATDDEHVGRGNGLIGGGQCRIRLQELDARPQIALCNSAFTVRDSRRMALDQIRRGVVATRVVDEGADQVTAIAGTETDEPDTGMRTRLNGLGDLRPHKGESCLE